MTTARSTGRPQRVAVEQVAELQGEGAASGGVGGVQIRRNTAPSVMSAASSQA